MAELTNISHGVRLVENADWPVLFTITGRVDSVGEVEEMPFVYDPNDPYGDLNPQIAAWLLSNPDFTIDPYVAPPPEPPAPLTLQQVASAQLVVSGWDITGVERCVRIAGAFMLSEDTAYVMFSEPFPDTNYLVIPDTDVTKFPDHVEVTHPGLSEISFIIQRVQ